MLYLGQKLINTHQLIWPPSITRCYLNTATPLHQQGDQKKAESSPSSPFLKGYTPSQEMKGQGLEAPGAETLRSGQAPQEGAANPETWAPETWAPEACQLCP